MNTHSTGYSSEEMRIIQFFISALQRRIEPLITDGKNPFVALDVTTRDVNAAPERIADSIALDAGAKIEMCGLLKSHHDLIEKMLYALKCYALIQFFEGEEPQQAIQIALMEYIENAKE